MPLRLVPEAFFQEVFRLSFQKRQGSTCLEPKASKPPKSRFKTCSFRRKEGSYLSIAHLPALASLPQNPLADPGSACMLMISSFFFFFWWHGLVTGGPKSLNKKQTGKRTAKTCQNSGACMGAENSWNQTQMDFSKVTKKHNLVLTLLLDWVPQGLVKPAD